MNRVLNILYVGNAQGLGNADRYYLIPQKLINGFTRCGHNVYVFNDRDYARASNIFGSSSLGKARVNAKLLTVACDFAPDLIVLGHCELVTNETLEAIRKSLPGTRIAYRNVDPLHLSKNTQHIRNRLPHVDGVFVTSAGETLEQFSNSRSFVSFMPNPVDPSIETGRACDRDGGIDVFFAGSILRDQHDQRQDMLKMLSKKLPGVRFDIRGVGSGQPKIFGKAYMDLLADSKMGLCLNKTDDFYLYASDRMAQYLGQGLFVLIHRKSGFQDLFDPGDLGLFDSPEELVDVIRFHHANNDARRRAATRSRERAHRIFNSSIVARYMVEAMFEDSFSQDYVWPVQRW